MQDQATATTAKSRIRVRIEYEVIHDFDPSEYEGDTPIDIEQAVTQETEQYYDDPSDIVNNAEAKLTVTVVGISPEGVEFVSDQLSSDDEE